MVDLSPQAAAVWAKSRNADGHWLPLHVHLQDSERLAARLWEEWLPRSVRRRLALGLGTDEAGAKALACFLAGVHDLGKASPIFSCAVPELFSLAVDTGLDPYVHADARPEFRHELISMAHLEAWLVARGVDRPAAQTWAMVVGSHHGVPHTAMSYQTVVSDARHWGGARAIGRHGWAEVRDELAARHWESSGMASLPALPGSLDQPAQLVLSSFVIVVDWIASNEEFFGYTDVNASDRLDAALVALGLPPLWQPRPEADVAEMLTQRFGVRGEPRPMQTALVATARSMPGPGIIVLEAAMGEGKTEAALMASEVLAQRFGLGGVQFALPTQATADALFARFLPWLEAQPDGSMDAGASVHLGHGKARLNQLFQSVPRGVRGIGEDAPHATVHPWLSGRKRQSLASFSVTTIDQVLMAGLRRKHVALRHLGLVGKVVIIDEVHAYDAWMSTYLDTVLAWLGQLDVPVLLLSATLPPTRRAEMLAAYAGRAVDVVEDTGYPLITWATRSDSGVERPAASGRASRLTIEACPDDEVVSRAVSAAGAGACVLVVRDTVAGAMETYAAVRERTHAASLHHSRFLAVDRARGDASLVRMFGRDGDRPAGWVAVATQVAEQSLDIDFDLVISEIAPMDLLLQRAGRLHRHPRPRPSGFERPVLDVCGLSAQAGEAPSLSTGAAAVYEPWLLWQTAALIAAHHEVTLPDDIPTLVAAAYAGTEVPPAWQQPVEAARVEMEQHLDAKRKGAAAFGIGLPQPGPMFGLVDAPARDDDSRAEAQVRDMEPSLEVIVLQTSADGAWCIPPWVHHELAGSQVPTDRAPAAPLAHSMLACTIRIPERLAGTRVGLLEMRLWESTPVAWEGSAASELPTLVLGSDRSVELAPGRVASYDPILGLVIKKEMS